MITSEAINFYSDQYLLHGILHRPDRLNPPIVIGCHGLLANSDSPKQIALAQLCTEAGIAYFRFDHRGCGKSQGEFEKVTTLSTRCTDLKSAIAAIFKRIESTYPIGLFGSSMGAAVCLSVASEMKTGPKVVVAPPIRTYDLTIPPQSVENGVINLSDKFYQNNLFFDLQDKLKKINNILIFHGDCDSVVPISNAYQLYKEAKDPKKLIVQKNGDHSMSNTIHQKKFQIEALNWIQKGFKNL